MADSIPKEVALNSVQVEALVVMKIVKHCTSSFPTTATGSIVGMDVNSTLQITNCFPFPTSDVAAPDAHPNDHMTASNAAAAAPRAKNNIAYQNEMIKYLREVNVDANNVGWYTSANMGNFVNLSLVENQYYYQKEVNERTVALVHDVSRSSQGALSLRAFRLSPTFMAAYKDGTAKFTTENMQKSKLSYKDILVELPIIVHNSHLLTGLLHQMPSKIASAELPLPSSLSELEHTESPLYPSYDSLDVSIDPFLEKSCDLLLDAVESHYTELNNFQYYQRQLAREQTKVTAWQTKRKAENASRAAAGQTPLNEEEWKTLFKLPTEPSRLEGMLLAAQISRYGQQVDGYTAAITSKMFAVKETLLPGESN